MKKQITKSTIFSIITIIVLTVSIAYLVTLNSVNTICSGPGTYTNLSFVRQSSHLDCDSDIIH